MVERHANEESHTLVQMELNLERNQQFLDAQIHSRRKKETLEGLDQKVSNQEVGSSNWLHPSFAPVKEFLDMSHLFHHVSFACQLNMLYFCLP